MPFAAVKILLKAINAYPYTSKAKSFLLNFKIKLT
jgi:hypothetical protein